MSGMVTELKNGQTEQSMRACGRTTKLTGREHSGMFMATNTRVNGKETKLMVMEHTHIVMGQRIRVIGETTCNMATESNIGMITQSMRGCTTKGRSMIRVYTPGKTDQSTMVNGLKIGFMELGSIPGMMGEPIMDNGKIIIWRVKVFIPGKTVGNMKVSTRRTKSMERVSTLGQTVENTMVSGKMVDNMVEASTSLKMVRKERVFGKMVKERDGLTSKIER